MLKAKLFSPALCVVVLLLFGCASYPGTGSLWVGMTRAQALRAMGPPESVSAQGGFEYLNYTLPVSGPGYVVGRPYSIRLVDGMVESYGYSAHFSAGGITPTAGGRMGAPAAVVADSIRVVSVEPTKLALGATNKVKVRVAYFFQGRPEAMISLGFNTTAPGLQLSLATKNVPAGHGELEIAVDVAPLDWPHRSDVKMTANLFPLPAKGAIAIAHTEWDLPVTR